MTRSLTEKVCASRLIWTCTGSASLIAKAAAQNTHGRVSAVGAPGSGRTTTTNSAAATAASTTVNSVIRWGTVSRFVRDRLSGALIVIVVTSLRPVRAGPADAGPAHAG